ELDKSYLHQATATNLPSVFSAFPLLDIEPYRARAANCVTKFPRIVLKMRQALTFLATFEYDDRPMQTLAVISILALLAISGAAYTDRVLISDQQATQRGN
ncbi:hypothetical protein KXV85_001501, partial [Aspergillus fumigatus]